MGDFTAIRPHVYVAGAVIYAANHNENEVEIYTQHNDSLKGATGHTHTGVDGDGPKIGSTGIDLTANYAWTGTHTFDTTTMYVDPTNNVVQFGTVGAVPASFSGVKAYISTTGNNCLLIESTSAGASGPIVYLHANSVSPITGDNAGDILFSGNNSIANALTYGRIMCEIQDPTSGSEAATLHFYTRRGGNSEIFLTGDGSTARIYTDSDYDVIIGANSPRSTSLTPKFEVQAGADSEVAIFSCTQSGATGAAAYLFQDSTTPTTNDIVGLLYFRGNNSVGTETNYGRIQVKIEDTTNGSEDASMGLYTIVGGAETQVVEINGVNQYVALASGWALNLPSAGGTPDANLIYRESGAKATCGVGVATSSTGSVTGYNVSGVTVSSWEATISWDTNFANTDYVAVAGIGETGSTTEGEFYIVNTDKQTSTASFQAFDDFLQSPYSSTYSFCVAAYGGQ